MATGFGLFFKQTVWQCVYELISGQDIMVNHLPNISSVAMFGIINEYCYDRPNILFVVEKQVRQ